MINGSPDGSGDSKIFAISADGEELEEIFEGPSFIRGISLSPDGKKLAFTMDLEMDIYTFDIETKELIKITDEPDIQFSNPIWSNDGLKLYVTKQNPESDIRVSIWEMNVDGSGLNQILADPDYSISSAHFSPIHDELVVIGSNYLPDNSVPRSIYLTNRELDDLRNISEGMEGFIVSSSNPRWSPDGSEIIFYTQYHSNRSHIYRYTLEGSELKQLTSDEAFYLNPVFSPVMR